MRVRRFVAACCAALGLLVGIAGCGSTQAQSGPPQAPPLPEVDVSVPVIREVTDFQDFPGRLAAVKAVEVRARVTGYLDRILFKDGAIVKEKQELCLIDPRPYRAELARAEGSVIQTEGRLKRLESDFERAQTLSTKKVISQEEIDRITSDRTEAQGALAVAKAARDIARLNLEFTTVTAPIAGRIGNRMLDEGNLVKADETAISVIVSLDSIYVYFDLDERTLLRLKRLTGDVKFDLASEKKFPVLIGLADEEGFPHRGEVNFADNRVDADSGTWRLRGKLDNDDGLLTPGQFVRVRLPIGEPVESLLIADLALGTDQGQKYVYVVDDKNQVVYRRVKIGRLHDGLRVVTDGLKSGERIVVSGLQRARPGSEVVPKTVGMPGAPPSDTDEKKTDTARSGETKAEEKPEGGK